MGPGLEDHAKVICLTIIPSKVLIVKSNYRIVGEPFGARILFIFQLNEELKNPRILKITG